jgi:dihydropteroate synthase
VKRPSFTWKLGSRSLELGARTLIMGVVNVTPDSFSDAGHHFDHHKAIEHALHMLEQGADLVDLGGESTRPGVEVGEQSAVPQNEELRRILPVLEGILKARPEAIVSVDTYKSKVACAALEAGAQIINDVSGGQWDREMLAALAVPPCGLVLMHTRGRPDQWRDQPKSPYIVAEVRDGLAQIAQSAAQAGIARERIVLDPGFGFGKMGDENYALLAHFSELHQLGFPLVAGTSRKGFIAATLAASGKSADCPPAERLFGTLATVTAAILEGAHVVRVHDVRAARDAAAVADAILKEQ